MGGSTRATSACVVQLGKQGLKRRRGKSHLSLLSEEESLKSHRKAGGGLGMALGTALGRHVSEWPLSRRKSLGQGRLPLRNRRYGQGGGDISHQGMGKSSRER